MHAECTKSVFGSEAICYHHRTHLICSTRRQITRRAVLGDHCVELVKGVLQEAEHGIFICSFEQSNFHEVVEAISTCLSPLHIAGSDISGTECHSVIPPDG